MLEPGTDNLEKKISTAAGAGMPFVDIETSFLW